MILILFITLFITASLIRWTLRNRISPMPTSSKVKKELLDTLPMINSGEILELGAGWGTLAFPLAKKFPGHQVIAYETSPIPFFFMRARQLLFPLPNLKVLRQDLFTAEFSKTSLVLCYLYPAAMKKLSIKCAKELPDDAWIISHTFALQEMKPSKVIFVRDLYNTPIYHYHPITRKN